jgi:hypothetical protein
LNARREVTEKALTDKEYARKFLSDTGLLNVVQKASQYRKLPSGKNVTSATKQYTCF